jgi:hypothetical protein
MEAVMGAKSVMSQSLFAETGETGKESLAQLLQGAQEPWRRIALMSVGLAGFALLVAIAAILLAIAG